MSPIRNKKRTVKPGARSILPVFLDIAERFPDAFYEGTVDIKQYPSLLRVIAKLPRRRVKAKRVAQVVEQFAKQAEQVITTGELTDKDLNNFQRTLGSIAKWTDEHSISAGFFAVGAIMLYPAPIPVPRSIRALGLLCYTAGWAIELGEAILKPWSEAYEREFKGE